MTSPDQSINERSTIALRFEKRVRVETAPPEGEAGRKQYHLSLSVRRACARSRHARRWMCVLAGSITIKASAFEVWGLLAKLRVATRRSSTEGGVEKASIQASKQQASLRRRRAEAVKPKIPQKQVLGQRNVCVCSVISAVWTASAHLPVVAYKATS